MIVKGLPLDSRTRTAQRDALDPEQLAQLAADVEWDGKHGRWSREATLLARLIDEVACLRAETLLVGSHGKAKPKDPTPVYRPGVNPPKPKRLNPEQAAFLARLRESRRAVT